MSTNNVAYFAHVAAESIQLSASVHAVGVRCNAYCASCQIFTQKTLQTTVQFPIKQWGMIRVDT